MSEQITRPVPPDAPDGYHYEPAEDDRCRLATADEHETRRCRWSSGHPLTYCQNRPVAAFLRGTTRPQWYLYCKEHMYGRWIEDGKVFFWRLVFDSMAADDWKRP